MALTKRQTYSSKTAAAMVAASYRDRGMTAKIVRQGASDRWTVYSGNSAPKRRRRFP